MKAIGLLISLVIPLSKSLAGIPEPDLIWYGKVLTASGGVNVRVTTGTLAWQIEPVAGGTPWTVSTALSNINDQFSFVLRVLCETPEPGVAATPGTVVLTTPAANYRRATVTLNGQPLSIANASTEFAPLPSNRGRTERIDLQLGSPPVDSDGDGLGDDWERQHFGNLSANPNDDPDNDGMSNLREYRAGTVPTDPQSLFEFVEITPRPEGIRIRWSSQTNRTYQLRRSSTLLTNPDAYQVIASGLVASTPTNEFLDTTTGGSTQFFYLVKIED